MKERIDRLPVDTGQSGWLAVSDRSLALDSLRGAKLADWLIIGAGFAGLSAARRLSQLRPGERIAILEAKDVAQGPAGRNSGFMIDLPHSLATGKPSSETLEQSRREIAENRSAIAFAAAAAEEYAMARDIFAPTGKINAAATARGENFNSQFAQSLHDLGEPFEMLDAKMMRDLTGSAYYSSGLRTPKAVTIQPASYVRSLAAGLKPRVDIYERSPVTGLKREDGLWKAQTPEGTVSAPKAILAVNGHIEDFGHFKGRLMHIFTYASMTAALKSGADGIGPTGAARWGILPADPMGATLRKISTPHGGRFVIRTRYTYEPSLRVSEDYLTRVVASQRQTFDARFPNLAALPFEYNWAGRLCLSYNQVPAFGEIEEDLYSACCCNGLGTVKSTLAGVLVAELATGTPSAVLENYRAQPAPSRLPPQPFAFIGINMVIRWHQFRAGREG